VPHEFTANLPCEEIVGRICRALRAAGFRVEQSFDLRSALTLVPDCTCPHHGTALCDCQYNVLLIYGQAPAPATLVVHGHDNQCWIALSDDPNGRAASALSTEISDTLAVDRLISPTQANSTAHQVPPMISS